MLLPLLIMNQFEKLLQQNAPYRDATSSFFLLFCYVARWGVRYIAKHVHWKTAQRFAHRKEKTRHDPALALPQYPQPVHGLICTQQLHSLSNMTCYWGKRMHYYHLKSFLASYIAAEKWNCPGNLQYLQGHDWHLTQQHVLQVYSECLLSVW